MAAVAMALERAGAAAGDVTAFAHGMTVATNALLEGSGARTVLVATEGFTDVVELGRQARADLYRLCAARPAPLVPPERRVAAQERCTPDGVLRALGDPASSSRRSRRWSRRLSRWCCCTPTRTRRTSRRSARRSPPRCPRSTCRCRTTSSAPSASTSAPRRPRSTRRSRRCCAATSDGCSSAPAQAGLPEPRIMQSSGGLAGASLAARHAAFTVLSGPAGGAAAAALVARRSGREDLVCFDMGGTSCDVCVVERGAVRETGSHPPREVGGRPLALPMVDIHTVGAGGGSVAWRDAGGALRVGPRSAGAVPGPGVLRPRRRGADGDRCQSRARPARWRRAARRRGARSIGGRARRRRPGEMRSASRSPPAPRASCASPTPR